LGWFDEIATPPALIVFVAAVVLTGAARVGFGPRRASLGPALVVPMAVFAVAGPPDFLPLSLLDQISILALAGFVLGAFLDLEQIDLWPRRAVIILAPLAGLVWVVARAGQLGMIEAHRNFVPALLTGSLIATVRIGRTSGSAMTAPIHLAATAIGLSLLAWIGGALALAQISAVIGLGLAGFFVWNWPLFRYPPGAAIVVGAAVPLAATAAALVLADQVPGTSMALLGLIFFSDWVVGFVSLGGGGVARAVRPLLVIAVGALAISGAVAVAL
jgi:hypothetical protein